MTATLFVAEDVERLKRKSQSFLNDWLVEGLLMHASRTEGAFWPFLSVIASGEPIDGLLACYSSGGVALQRKLRAAIAGACAVLSPTSAAFIEVNPAVRRAIFKDMSALVPAMGAYEATSRLVASVTDHEPYWAAEGLHADVFARAYRICCELAINAKDHIDGTRNNLDALESDILKLSAAPGFRVDFAPLGVHALVCIDPKRFLTRHRPWYGFRIRALHKLDPAQRGLAHITANMIARSARKELADVSPNLDLAEGGGDRWLVEALTDEKSEFKLIRTEDPSEVKLVLSGQGSEVRGAIGGIRLRNAAFVKEHFDFASPTVVLRGTGLLGRLGQGYDLVRQSVFGRRPI